MLSEHGISDSNRKVTGSDEYLTMRDLSLTLVTSHARSLRTTINNREQNASGFHHGDHRWLDYRPPDQKVQRSIPDSAEDAASVRGVTLVKSAGSENSFGGDSVLPYACSYHIMQGSIET